jgi:tetratricopeptide (TPR) repeat protein
MRLARSVLVLALAGGLASCASLPERLAWLPRHLLPHHAPALKVIPVETQLASAAPTDEGFYQDAKEAIEARDYVSALDLLEAAKDRKHDDVRVLNAFGVVYDSLGKFDVAVRYYAEAKKLDPTSPIIAQNEAYSAMLQKTQAGEAPKGLALAVPKYSPHDGPHLAVVSPKVIMIQGGVATGGLALAQPVLTGHPLVLVDATGHPGIAEPLRLALADHGWTAPKAAERSAAPQARSEIRFAPEARLAAAALARTLPGEVELAACNNGCQGVQLILGVDAASWGAHGLRHKA